MSTTAPRTVQSLWPGQKMADIACTFWTAIVVQSWKTKNGSSADDTVWTIKIPAANILGIWAEASPRSAGPKAVQREATA